MAILEDDLVPSTLLKKYFDFGKEVLAVDDTVMSVSAWNDNQIEAHSALYMMREEHFGGLGFMISKKIWLDRFRPDIL